MSGYTDCACRDCFEIAISGDREEDQNGKVIKCALCWECEQAGCSQEGDEDCQRPDAYEG